VATSTTREKAQKEEVCILKSGGSVELFGFSGVGEVSCKLDVNVMCNGNLHALNLEKLATW
jgi:hypothetical protein